MKMWSYTLLACLTVSSCSFNPSVRPAAITPVSTAMVEQQLQELWDRLDEGSAPTNKPSIVWSVAYSALFPLEWPPTPATIWIRYAYAQGMDLDLHDGVRVAAPSKLSNALRSQWFRGSASRMPWRASAIFELPDRVWQAR